MLAGIQKSINDVRGEGLTLHQLGSIDLDLDHFVEARSKIECALNLYKGISARAEEQPAWHQLGSIDLLEKKFNLAEEKLQRALAIARSLGDAGAEAAALNQLGRVAAQAGQSPLVSLAYLKSALDLRQRIGDATGEAQTFRRLGDLFSGINQEQVAIRFLIVSYYLYGTLDETKYAEAVKQQALGIGCDNFDELATEIKQEYLGDRGQRLLEVASGQLSAHITT